MTQITEPVSGATNAAMFLMGIGDQVSAELLRQLDADEIRQVTSQISLLEAVAPHHMMSVFREFESLTGSSRFFAKGGAGYARRLIEQALGTESTQKLLDATEPSAAAGGESDRQRRRGVCPSAYRTGIGNRVDSETPGCHGALCGREAQRARSGLAALAEYGSAPVGQFPAQ